MKRLLPLVIIFCCLSGITGCSESDCPLGSNPLLSIAFKDTLGGKSFTLNDTLTVTALGTDSILINRQKGATSLVLPLQYIGNETEYIFTYLTPHADTIRLENGRDSIVRYSTRSVDTLKVIHTNRQHFISLDCGIMMYYHIDSVWSTRHRFDSLRVNNPELDEYEKTNIEIYFTPGN